MIRCSRCHRPLKNASPTGMGATCARKSAPAPSHERDLFGYDLDKACAAALYRLNQQIEMAAWQAHQAITRAARAARYLTGVWA